MDSTTDPIVSDVSTDSVRDLELAAAFDSLNGLIDWLQVDEIMPLGPATIYTASITLWLLVYQGMHPRASLSEAVLHLINHQPEHLPINKPAISQRLTASDATGTEVVESDRSQRDRTLSGNDVVETTPMRPMSLESLRDSITVDADQFRWRRFAQPTG